MAINTAIEWCLKQEIAPAIFLFFVLSAKVASINYDLVLAAVTSVGSEKIYCTELSRNGGNSCNKLWPRDRTTVAISLHA